MANPLKGRLGGLPEIRRKHVEWIMANHFGDREPDFDALAAKAKATGYVNPKYSRSVFAGVLMLAWKKRHRDFKGQPDCSTLCR